MLVGTTADRVVALSRNSQVLKVGFIGLNKKNCDLLSVYYETVHIKL
jgi:hypothetical protein